jgi:acetyltransferase-like isoleucine patch superfamily enzyme
MNIWLIPLKSNDWSILLCHTIPNSRGSVMRAQRSDAEKWLRFKQKGLSKLVLLLPALPGLNWFRYLCCKQLFAKIGRSVFLGDGLEIAGGDRIWVGHYVSLARNVHLDAKVEGSQIVLGNHVSLGRYVGIDAGQGGTVQIGDHTLLNDHVLILGDGGIEIGANCLIAPYVTLVASNRDFSDPFLPINQQGITAKGIVIEDDCWLGNRVSVNDGVTIGRGSVIGAGAVVTKDIPPYSVAVGVPAKVMKRRLATEANLPVCG